MKGKGKKASTKTTEKTVKKTQPQGEQKREKEETFPITPEDFLGKNNRVFWHNDSATGRTSIQILLDWLTTEGNYDKYKGGSTTKDKVRIVSAVKSWGL